MPATLAVPGASGTGSGPLRTGLARGLPRSAGGERARAVTCRSHLGAPATHGPRIFSPAGLQHMDFALRAMVMATAGYPAAKDRKPTAGLCVITLLAGRPGLTPPLEPRDRGPLRGQGDVHGPGTVKLGPTAAAS